MNIQFKAQQQFTIILFAMDPKPITPTVSPKKKKSHKKIKVLHRPIQTFCSSSTNNDLTNNKSNPSVVIHASSIDTTPYTPYIRSNNLTHRLNCIT